MRLSNRKISTFFIFLSWLTICSSAVFAQNKMPEQPRTAFGDFHSDARQNESETEIVTSSEKSIVDEANVAPNIFPEGKKGGKNIVINRNFIKSIEAEPSLADENETNDFAYHFQTTDQRKKRLEFKNLADAEEKEISPRPFSAVAVPSGEAKNVFPSDATNNDKTDGFHWRAAIGQSLLFLAVQHGYAVSAQAKTRRDLRHGAFWRDYVDSVKSLHGWDDGGRFFTNYIAHPMQGALTGFIYVQNSPSEKKLKFNESPAYWRSRLKAFVWSAAWSTQFELGPVSQSSIGNVGLHGKETWGDIVVTPTIGTALLIGEDAVDRFITKRIERNTNNFYVKIFARMLLNPSRNFSNFLRFKQPWYRD